MVFYNGAGPYGTPIARVKGDHHDTEEIQSIGSQMFVRYVPSVPRDSQLDFYGSMSFGGFVK